MLSFFSNNLVSIFGISCSFIVIAELHNIQNYLEYEIWDSWIWDLKSLEKSHDNPESFVFFVLQSIFLKEICFCFSVLLS